MAPQRMVTFGGSSWIRPFLRHRTPSDPPDAAPTPAELTEPPVAAPVVQPFEFDISQCDTYGLEWLIDLKDSCDDFDTFDGCECSSAQALFDAGEITCAQEGDGSPPACPSDCEVCKACLVRVLGCPDIYDGMDSSDPEAPPAEFDIAHCSSYALEWLIDLQETCTDFDTFEGCECTSAQALFDAGEITCAQEGDGSPPACPSDCEVCKTCLVLDLGCPDVYGGLDPSGKIVVRTGTNLVFEPLIRLFHCVHIL